MNRGALASCAGSVREDMEMSEQELVQATEVSAPSQEPQPQETQPVETMQSDMPVSDVAVSDMPASDMPASDVNASEATTAEATTPVAATSDAAASETADDADDDGPVVKLLSVGQALQGTVKRITEFGAFVDIGVGRDGLVHISELSTTRVAKVSDLLKEGQPVTLWILSLIHI